jgi:hypothetical protein
VQPVSLLLQRSTCPLTFRFSGVADAQLRLDTREYAAVHGRLRTLTDAVVAVTVAVGDTVGPSASEGGESSSCDHSPYASPTLNSLASASSSRSQVHARTASAAVRLTWERPSVGVHWRPPLAVVIVTHLVTQSLPKPSTGRDCSRQVSAARRTQPGNSDMSASYPSCTSTAFDASFYLGERGSAAARGEGSRELSAATSQ